MDTAHNRYEIIETLGIGATSRVDKARDPLIGRTVALKTFLQGFGSRDLQQQFVREAQIIGRLSHPNIVALYDVGTDKDGVPYFVMEYVEGKTLEGFLAASPLPLPRVALWAGDLASALGRAHQANIIHGDVKPANILVTPEGQVKLGDFGVARFATQTSGGGSLMGTPAYLSPEQILGNSNDPRSDLFSLGIILYQLSCGVRPFDGSSVGAVCAQIISCEPPPPSHHNPSLPAAFDRVVMRCLAKDPTARYPTAEALASSLYPFARKSGIAPPQSTRLAPRHAPVSWWSGPLQHKDMWVAAAGLLLVLTAVSAVRASRKHAIRTVASASVTSVPPSAASASLVAPADSSSSALVQIRSVSIVDSNPTNASSSAAEPASETASSVVPVTSPRKRPRPSSLRKTAEAVASPVGPASPAPPPVLNNPITPAEAPRRKDRTSLSIEILSTVANETLAVYAGPELLLSTPLEAAHVSKTLHFDCPLSAGSHPLRVVLYNANLDLHLQKEGLSEILAEGTNTLGIRIIRRPKRLIRKETALEISWPNQLSAAAHQGSPATAAAGASK